MTAPLRRPAGAAPPRAYGVRAALAAADCAECGSAGVRQKPAIRTPGAATQPLATARALARDHGWAVRDQGDRSTCNAFAVVAAEEVWHVRQGLAPRWFSEEYLYATMREQGVPDHAADAKDKIEADGSTFLEQAVTAIAADGLLPADLLPYDDDPRLPPNHETEIAQALRDQSWAPPGGFVHDIDEGHDSGAQDAVRKWRSGRTEPVSEIIADALEAGAPVVASFALLDDPGDAAWYGHRARLDGEVRYPGDRVSGDMHIVGGHTVCLLAFLPGETPAQDAFVLRNSFGADAFGGAPSLGPWAEDVPAPGYGIVSAGAVDRFCWEYLHRET